MKIKIPTIKFEQPGGTFYYGVMSFKDIQQIYTIIPRYSSDDQNNISEGIQRQLSEKKLDEIAEYALDPDATFPTPIIFSLFSKDVELESNLLLINSKDRIAEIIDGQHRVVGVEKAFNIQPEIVSKIEFPVVFIFDATLEQKAYIFATINSKQTKVSSSLIADLYGVSNYRTPRKVTHEIARALNSSKDSPFYRKLNMLGQKSTNIDTESLSQGTFARELLKRISKDPDRDAYHIKVNKQLESSKVIFNKYFINGEDEVIYKILLNAFSAINKTWPEEWNNHDQYILSKTAGFEAIMIALDTLVPIGQSQKDLSENFFLSFFSKAKSNLKRDNLELTSSNFSSQRAGVKRLVGYLTGE